MLQNIGLAAWPPKQGENPGSDHPGRYFLAPEQEKNNSDIVAKPGPATDIYQLGALLYFLITGQTILPGSLVSFHNHAAPSQLSATIRNAVSREPAQRWHSMEEFSAALKQSL